MKRLIVTILAVSLLSAYALAQQQSPGNGSQNSQDVPHQQPGTNNPDLGKQRQPAPAAPGDKSPHEGDVPRDQPGTSNPDLNKQHAPTPKKKKGKKSTADSART